MVGAACAIRSRQMPASFGVHGPGESTMASGAGATPGLLGGAKERLSLVDAFLLLRGRVGIGNDAGPCLHIHAAVLDERGAQHDANVEVAGGGEIAAAARVDPALLPLQRGGIFYGV